MSLSFNMYFWAAEYLTNEVGLFTSRPTSRNRLQGRGFYHNNPEKREFFEDFDAPFYKGSLCSDGNG